MAILASETVDTVEKFTPLYPLACRCFGGRNCYIRTGEKKEEEKRPLDWRLNRNHAEEKEKNDDNNDDDDDDNIKYFNNRNASQSTWHPEEKIIYVSIPITWRSTNPGNALGYKRTEGACSWDAATGSSHSSQALCVLNEEAKQGVPGQPCRVAATARATREAPLPLPVPPVMV